MKFDGRRCKKRNIRLVAGNRSLRVIASLGCNTNHICRSTVAGVRAAMDGTHIRIRCPGEELRQAYYNKDGYYSFVLHAVCDDRFGLLQLVCSCFIPIRGIVYEASVGNCGSAGDSTVWRNQPLHAQLQRIDEGKSFISLMLLRRHKAGVETAPEDFWLSDGTFIVSDQAYCTRAYQVQPFSRVGTLTSKQMLFNRRVSLARRIVERLFGQLKKRWKVSVMH